uniref:Transcriptional regulator n=1 Tax=Rhabditophanes sp. KR3021 TaxID=114890 RepID=A0AC35U1Y1_9BILA
MKNYRLLGDQGFGKRWIRNGVLASFSKKNREYGVKTEIVPVAGVSNHPKCLPWKETVFSALHDLPKKKWEHFLEYVDSGQQKANPDDRDCRIHHNLLCMQLIGKSLNDVKKNNDIGGLEAFSVNTFGELKLSTKIKMNSPSEIAASKETYLSKTMKTRLPNCLPGPYRELIRGVGDLRDKK